MPTIEARYTGDAPATDRLVLDFEHRNKSRLRAQLASHSEVTLFLPRGTVLRDGDKLLASDGNIIEVVSAPEKLLEAYCATPLVLARAAYRLGNRHVAVSLGGDVEAGFWLRILHDHVLGQMLEGLGITVSELEAPFEPESGAYAGGHHHGGETTSGARIHLMRPK